MNKAELDRRVTIAYEMILQVKSTGSIVQHLASETGVSIRQCHDYVAMARERLAEEYKIKREHMAATQLAKLESIAQLATQDKQYSAAVGAMAAANRMMSLDPGK